jgi:hypothetical protein
MRKLLFTLLCLSIHGIGLAEDNKDHFYEKNYANKIFEPPKPVDEKKEKSDDKDKTNGSSGPQPQQTKTKVQDGFSELSAPQSKDLEDGNSETVTWIGLVTTANQGDLTRNAVRNLQKIVRRYDFRVGEILSLGFDNFQPIDPAVLSELAIRGAVFNFGVEAPEHLPIKKTPAWIIGTDTGEVLLEGILDPSLFFNSDGKYVGDPNEKHEPTDKEKTIPPHDALNEDANSDSETIKNAQKKVTLERNNTSSLTSTVGE